MIICLYKFTSYNSILSVYRQVYTFQSIFNNKKAGNFNVVADRCKFTPYIVKKCTLMIQKAPLFTNIT